MVDEASPFLGWDCEEYLKFSPKASNDVLGSFYFFLRHTLLRFCRRIKELDIHFHLSNIDARILPAYLSAEDPRLFDRIEVCFAFQSCPGQHDDY